MNLKNKIDIESFIANKDEHVRNIRTLLPQNIQYNTLYIPIDVWLRYVNHINQLMILDPSLRFSVEISDVENLSISNQTEPGYVPVDLPPNIYVMPDQFTVNCDVYLSGLGDISIPNNFIINNKTLILTNTRLRKIPLNLFGAEMISFTCGLNSMKSLKDYYETTLLPLKKSLNIVMKSEYRITVTN